MELKVQYGSMDSPNSVRIFDRWGWAVGAMVGLPMGALTTACVACQQSKPVGAFIIESRDRLLHETPHAVCVQCGTQHVTENWPHLEQMGNARGHITHKRVNRPLSSLAQRLNNGQDPLD